MVMDFADLDAVVLEKAVNLLDHQDLNETLSNPTAEEVVTFVGHRLSAAGLNWTQLRLWETESGSVILER